MPAGDINVTELPPPEIAFVGQRHLDTAHQLFGRFAGLARPVKGCAAGIIVVDKAFLIQSALAEL
jgi:hypothetical protein